MAYIIDNGRNSRSGVLARTGILCAIAVVFSFASFGQTPTCTASALPPTVHAEGLSELIGDISFSCSGASGTVTTQILVALNANVTNRLDTDGNLKNVLITGAGTSLLSPFLVSPTTVSFGSVQLAGAAASFTITGIRVAVPTVSGGGSTPLITASIVANQLNVPSQPFSVAISAATLLSSVLNYGVPCIGSPAPATADFPGLIAGGAASSTVRITEANPAAFAPKSAGADFGVRFVVKLSGYGSNSTVYVPDVVVGNRGLPTNSGAFGSSASGGTYTFGLNQLLLTRVSNADSAGLGGTLFLVGPPGGATSFTSVTQVPLINGAGYVTYEVLDGNPGLTDSAQIPVFVVAPPGNCTAPLANTLGATLAPVSAVAVPTEGDPIPRYVSSTPGSDCQLLGDCSAPYFPILQVDPTSLTLNGSSLGPVQTSFITLTDGGSNQLSFTVATAYQPATGQSAANWLSLNATSGVVGPTADATSFTLAVSADPAAILIQGAYQATVTIGAGSAGTITVPITFNVSPAGPIIQGIVNAANSQPGPLTPGSFASIYGVNLVPKNPPATVTFNGFPAVISYDGQPTATSPAQINVLVPAGLGSAAKAGVVATIDGAVSNTFVVNLVANAPAVFNPGILNQNNTVNLASAPASRGDIVQIFLTGLSTPVDKDIVTVNIGTQVITGGQVIYAGAVPSIPGLEQVNVQVPPALPFNGNAAPLSICVPGADGQPTCSAPVSLYLQ
jgi:uncharacterized protein (TIGR03437 family)